MKRLSSLIMGIVLSTSVATNLSAGNKFGLPNFEKMTPSIKDYRRIDNQYIIRAGSTLEKPVLFRTFREGYVVVSIDCPYKGETKRFEMFIRDGKKKKSFQRYNISHRLKEVPYETQIEWDKIFCPVGENLA